MRSVFIGDVHGCLEELDELLHLLDAPAQGDSLFFLGDLVDRGPESLGVVRRVQEIRAQCVLGNHESKYIRYGKQIAKGTANLDKDPRFLKIFNDMRSHMEWLDSLPVMLKTVILLPEQTKTIYAVHGGFMPGVPIDRQQKGLLPYLRDIYESNGKPVHFNGTVQLGTFHWADRWDGPFTVYGHSVFEKVKRSPNALGIDTGCCFGGSLTAYIVDCDTLEESFISVEAKRAPAGVFR